MDRPQDFSHIPIIDVSELVPAWRITSHVQAGPRRPLIGARAH
jgi:hypothetical protein